VNKWIIQDARTARALFSNCTGTAVPPHLPSPGPCDKDRAPASAAHCCC